MSEKEECWRDSGEESVLEQVLAVVIAVAIKLENMSPFAVVLCQVLHEQIECVTVLRHNARHKHSHRSGSVHNPRQHSYP